MGSELVSVTLPLRYCGTAEELTERPLPRWWGRAVQSVLLNLIREIDEPFAALLHEADRPRPYTASGLIGFRNAESLTGGAFLSLRFTALTEPMAAVLDRLSEPGMGFSPGSRLTLDYLPFEIAAADDPGLRVKVSYADLIAAGMAASGRSALDFRLYSPTIFKSDGKTQPLPLPALVFRSLLERWNAFAPVTFPTDLLRYAEECLAVSGFEIRSVPAELGENALRIGAAGRVRYRALNPDRYWVSVLHALAQFSKFSGIGAGTAYGLGQADAILPKPEKKP